MAKTKYNDTYSLLSYLTKPQVLGRIKIYFEARVSSELEANIIIADDELKCHLEECFQDWLSEEGDIYSSLEMVISNEDSDVEIEEMKATDNHDFDDNECYSEMIEYLEMLIGKSSSINLSMEGDSFNDVKNVNVKDYYVCIFDNDNNEIDMSHDKELKEKIIKKYLSILENYSSSAIEEIFNFSITINDRLSFYETGNAHPRSLDCFKNDGRDYTIEI